MTHAELIKPTDAAPGSEEKIEVMAARCEAGLPLHVEGDQQEHHSNSDTGVFARGELTHLHASGAAQGRAGMYVKCSPGAPREMKGQRGDDGDE